LLNIVVEEYIYLLRFTSI